MESLIKVRPGSLRVTSLEKYWTALQDEQKNKGSCTDKRWWSRLNLEVYFDLAMDFWLQE